MTTGADIDGIDGINGAPLSVALLTYSTKPRGGVVHTVELAEALQDLGVEVRIYALNKDRGGFYRTPRCPYTLVPAAPAPTGIDAVVAQRIEEFVTGLRDLGGRHDIWHSQDCISANALAVLRAEGRVPHFIRTVHHLDDYDSPYLRACQERSVREADACLSVSAAWQKTLRAELGVDTAIVPNGVSTRRFNPGRDSTPDGREEALRRRLSAFGSPLYVTVGGVEPRKNSIGLLQAFIEVRRRLPRAQLIIAGGETLFDYAPYQREFAAIARAAGLLPAEGNAAGTPESATPPSPPPLVLAGVLPDELIPPLYRLADAFVFPSVREGFGLALLEAMASGTPVVSSAQPPFTEFLTDGVSALLVDPTRIDALARAMEAILDEGVQRRLRAAAIETAAGYTWDRSARIAAGVYRDFLSSRRSP